MLQARVTDHSLCNSSPTYIEVKHLSSYEICSSPPLTGFYFLSLKLGSTIPEPGGICQNADCIFTCQVKYACLFSVKCHTGLAQWSCP